ncbi:MAG: hypothetical protein KAV87_59450 [Desulfobacteraceae bacterium]|nr:hypothetical protein [Desulfobacteraceae bacterium]
MDEMIKKAIEALQGSTCNEIELTNASGMKVRVIKYSLPVDANTLGYYYSYSVPRQEGTILYNPYSYNPFQY